MVTPEQLISANQKMVQGKYYRQLADSLHNEKLEYLEAIDVFKLIVSEKDTLINSKNLQLRNLEEIGVKNGKICDEEKKALNRKRLRDGMIGVVIGILIGLAIAL